MRALNFDCAHIERCRPQHRCFKTQTKRNRRNRSKADREVAHESLKQGHCRVHSPTSLPTSVSGPRFCPLAHKPAPSIFLVPDLPLNVSKLQNFCCPACNSKGDARTPSASEPRTPHVSAPAPRASWPWMDLATHSRRRRTRRR